MNYLTIATVRRVVIHTRIGVCRVLLFIHNKIF